MVEYYKGPFRIIGTGTLVESKRLERGEILAHASGNVFILRCPKCGRSQFVAGHFSGSPDAPTFERPVVCGSGACKSCEYAFQIVNGEAVQVASPTTMQEIRDDLKLAGVKPPPKAR